KYVISVLARLGAYVFAGFKSALLVLSLVAAGSLKLFFPCKSTICGAAKQMDEYVATIIPIKMAKEKPLITSPPKMKRIAITKITVSDVTIVRLNVRLIARLTVSAIASFFRRGMPKYSRKR